jgi:outer membrane protein assembly factor BamB
VRRAIFICLTLFVSVTTAQADAMFRGDAMHSGVYAGRGPATAPKVAWQFHIAARFIASPALDQGVLYDGGTDGKLYALDAKTGALRWSFKTGSRIVSSPAAAKGVVYTLSYDGNLYAVNARDGTLKWKFATGGERRFAARHIHGIDPPGETMPDPYDVYLSSPAVADGTVYFGSSDGNVYALDAASGALRWKFATGGVVHASPALANGALYIGSWDTWFYALDAATGKEKWRFKTGEDEDIHNQTGIQGSAAVADGIVTFGCRDAKFYALDAATGKKLWAYDNKGSWVIASPAVRDGAVYVPTSDSGMFHAFDAKTGAERFSLSFAHWPAFSSPALAGHFAYFGSSFRGKFYAVDLDKHAIAWEFETEANRKDGARFVAKDGTPNYGADYSENFYDTAVATLVRMQDLGGFFASPVVGDGMVYAAGADGTIYALADGA